MNEPSYVLNDEDRRMILELKAFVRNYKPRLNHYVESDTDDTPDAYIIRTPAAGISGLMTVGTGTSDDDVPGSEECNIYQLIDEVGTSEDPYLLPTRYVNVVVYNLQEGHIPGNTWQFVVKDKYGRWVVVGLPVRPAILSRCQNGGTYYIGGMESGYLEEITIPVSSIVVDLPQDVDQRTYYVLAEASAQFSVEHLNSTAGGNLFPFGLEVAGYIEVASALYSGGGWPVVTSWDSYQFISFSSGEVVMPQPGSPPPPPVAVGFTDGSLFGTVFRSTPYDYYSTTGGYAIGATGIPQIGINTPPDKTIIMMRLRFTVSFTSSHFLSAGIGAPAQINWEGAINSLQVNKEDITLGTCGPVDAASPPPPPPPGGSYLVAITITTGGGGGTILGGVQVTVTDSGATVEDVTVTPAKLPYTYYLVLTNDTYTVTAEYAATGTPMTVSTGSFTIAGADMTTTQDVT